MGEEQQNGTKKKEGGVWFTKSVWGAAAVLVLLFGIAGYLAAVHIYQCRGLWVAVKEIGPFIPGIPKQYNACLSLNEFGDFLAGAFAPLAFLGLMLTVAIQARELKEQRNALLHSIDVAEGQKDEIEKQRLLLEKQTGFMNKISRRNEEQQAREELASAVGIIRPVVMEMLLDTTDYTYLRYPDGLYLAIRLSSAVNRINSQDLVEEARLGGTGPNPEKHNELVKQLRSSVLSALISVRPRLSKPDLDLYKGYGLDNLVKALGAKGTSIG